MFESLQYFVAYGSFFKLVFCKKPTIFQTYFQTYWGIYLDLSGIIQSKKTHIYLFLF